MTSTTQVEPALEHDEKEQEINTKPQFEEEKRNLKERSPELESDSEPELPSQNDILVLEGIGGDKDAKQNLSFQGIKRKLGLHQETLSRALHRLQRDGFVEKVDQGYRISSKGKTALEYEHPSTSAGAKLKVEGYPVSILTAILPEDVSVQDIVSSLSYKWFANLRWLGSAESEDSTTMTWITNEGDQKISVKIRGDSMTIESYARAASSVSQAIMSAYELFEHVTRVFKSGFSKYNPPSTSRKSAAS